jgi:dTDP-4-dehydrorhamnose reductase
VKNSGKILVIGSNGQIGSSICTALGNRAIGLGSEALDLAEPEKITPALNHYSPLAIINTAAYTAVDKAESETELARKVNADAVEVLANWAFSRHIPFIHYSTDYVFEGSGTNKWSEEDNVNPINAYARTKLEGEQKLQEAASKFKDAKWLLFRICWVYDSEGKNFLSTMIRLGMEKESLSIVSDQIGSPSYAPDIAKATLKALETASSRTEFPSGIYHMCNAGEVSWAEFAEAIFKEARKKSFPLKVKKVRHILSSEYPTPAKRPLNSRLSCEKLQNTLGITMPIWQDGLVRCMDNIKSPEILLPEHFSSIAGK